MAPRSQEPQKQLTIELEEPVGDTRINQNDLLDEDNIINCTKPEISWRVVYTPGRLPKKKDYDTHYFIIKAKDYAEAVEKSMLQLNNQGFPIKNKWIKIFKEVEGNKHE